MDFVERDPVDRRCDAWKAAGESADLRLDYVLDYWGEGQAATCADIPVIDEGPFGKAVDLRTETDPTFRPMVPPRRLRPSLSRGHSMNQ